MLTGISIVCFASSYGITFALEVSRLFFRARARTALSLGFAVAGLLTHTLFLYNETGAPNAGSAALSSWYHWCLMTAWVLAVVYVAVALAHPKTTLGVFLLPLVLALVGLARLFRAVYGVPAPVVAGPLKFWGVIHGVTLLLACVAVMLGFVSGMMYLVQAYRLKHKRLPSRKFPLPSLEWLGRVNGRSIIVSTCLLAAGLFSGILLNMTGGTVTWTDPAVWASGVLLAWLTTASLFEVFYRPVRVGHKVAYLTLASFLFFACVLGLVLFASPEHTHPKNKTNNHRVEPPPMFAWTRLEEDPVRIGEDR